MKIHGWCQSCKRVKRVRVSAAGLARVGRGVVVGTCDTCSDDQEKDQRTREA